MNCTRLRCSHTSAGTSCLRRARGATRSRLQLAARQQLLRDSAGSVPGNTRQHGLGRRGHRGARRALVGPCRHHPHPSLGVADGATGHTHAHTCTHMHTHMHTRAHDHPPQLHLSRATSRKDRRRRLDKPPRTHAPWASVPFASSRKAAARPSRAPARPILAIVLEIFEVGVALFKLGPPGRGGGAGGRGAAGMLHVNLKTL